MEPLLDVGMVGVGSGPALVLEFARAMTGGMEAGGMPPALAEQGIMSLLRGTAELVRGSDRSPADFQRSVVTPGGITAEALKAMEEASSGISLPARSSGRWTRRLNCLNRTRTDSTEKEHYGYKRHLLHDRPLFRGPRRTTRIVQGLCANAFVETTRTEPGCLYYGFSFDGGRAHCREAYENAEAALCMSRTSVRCSRNPKTLRRSSSLKFTVPEQELAKMREPLAALNPRFYTLEYGFRR